MEVLAGLVPMDMSDHTAPPSSARLGAISLTTSNEGPPRTPGLTTQDPHRCRRPVTLAGTMPP
jgi:hypothetical protein